MTATLVDGVGPVDAWKRVVALLGERGDMFNVVVNIAEPLGFTEEQLHECDPRKKLHTARSVEDVANTIFPKKSAAWDLSDEDFARHYGQAYEKLLKRGPRSWGVYFLRLIEFGPSQINQLKKIVTGMSTWGRNHKAAFVIHFSSAQTDAPRPLGAPCLQYCEFIREGDHLSLTAVYRSHDYFLKALGNFIGLARLLEYVAYKVGLPVGTIVCHSTYAYLDGNKSRALSLAAGVK